MSTWYRTGTVAVTNGNQTIVGTGTLWTLNASAGDIFIGPDLAQYEITVVTDDTHINIKTLAGVAGYAGATLSNQNYAIIRNFTSTLPSQLAAQLTTLVTNWQTREDQFRSWHGGTANGGPSFDGNYPLTDAVGVSQNVACPAKLQALAGGTLKLPVKCATTASITLSGTQTIDTIAVNAGDRVLVKNQTTGSQNGIYVASASAWTLAADFDVTADAVPGCLVPVQQGATLGMTIWQLTNTAVNLGSTALTFAQVYPDPGRSPIGGPGSAQGFATGPLTVTGGISGTDGINVSQTNTSLGISRFGTVGAYATDIKAHRLCINHSSSTPMVAAGDMAYIEAGNASTNSSADGYLALGVRTTDILTERMRLDSSGNLLVGVTSGTYHVIKKSGLSESNVISAVWSNLVGGVSFYAINSGGENAAGCGFSLGKNSTTGRSINAGGTINASGADYAEYERKATTCGNVIKGQIIGFDANGHVTDKWAEAISFGVKTTNPSYVGGDAWGTEYIIGKRPEEPVRKQTVTDIEWQAEQDAYKADLATFEARLEAERQKVDRIAYSGKVPCNVTAAVVGDYIIATQDGEGIKGIAVANPTFDQYRLAVGRVRRVLADGRPEVAVIVH